MALNDLNKNNWDTEFQKSEKDYSGIYSKIDNFSKPVFWTIIVAFILVAAGIGFFFYSYFINRDIAFSLNTPRNTLSGAPFNIDVGVKNNFNNSLNDVKISLVLPDGAFFAEESQEKRFYDKNFGDLEKGSYFQERIPVIIISDSQVVKKFSVKISYYTPALGSKARFEQVKTVDISTEEPAIKLDISAPKKILNNEDFEVEISYQNISNVQFENVKLKLEYPSFFIFKNSTMAPSLGNETWEFNSLPANGSNGNFIITGKVINSNESLNNFEIKCEIIAEVLGQRYSINKKSAQLNIATSPLTINISLNNDVNYIVFLRNTLRYKINYHNSSDVGLNDVIITAKLTGEVFDFKSLTGNGFFESKNNTITWNVANTPELKIINPNNGGYVEFQIQAKENYPIKRQSDKNFTLNVSAEISSPTVAHGVTSDKTINFTNLKNNVSGAVTIIPKLFFYDPSSGISNKGQLPLVVNKSTNFTIHWTIINYSTDISDIKISGFLQSGIRWTGQVKSNINSLPSYNERTNEVTWNIDKILATQGVISSPIEAIFQIEATPNITQANQLMPILSKTTIQAMDNFNNKILINSATAISSEAIVGQ